MPKLNEAGKVCVEQGDKDYVFICLASRSDLEMVARALGFNHPQSSDMFSIALDTSNAVLSFMTNEIAAAGDVQ